MSNKKRKTSIFFKGSSYIIDGRFTNFLHSKFKGLNPNLNSRVDNPWAYIIKLVGSSLVW